MEDLEKEEIERNRLANEFLRYVSFWPVITVLIIISIIISSFYLRYAEYYYATAAKIEIIDKAQDPEMALPTSMTIFNRSMINLENEIGVLTSYSMHSRTVKRLKSNVKFYNVGRLKTTESSFSDWCNRCTINYKLDTDSIVSDSYYELKIIDGNLSIEKFNKDDEFLKKYSFKGLTTSSKLNDLPFSLEFNANESFNNSKIISFYAIDDIIQSFKGQVKITPSARESDQLDISISHPNPEIAEDYLNTLINEFDNDGIADRQLEYKRTIDFVDQRSVFLAKELKQVELRKQQFLEENNLADIESDASISINQKIGYNEELFNAMSQKDLLLLLKNEISSNDYQLLPANFGLESESLNELIREFNLLISERIKFLESAGRNNRIIKNIESQINNYIKNIEVSLINYEASLDIIIKNLGTKEVEFSDTYFNIPEKSKILRSIERELEVKEALFVLLLQKREEASINFAVIKPSIKIIDYAKSSRNPVDPNKFTVVFSAILSSIILAISGIYIHFLIDNKIHTKKQLTSRLPNIPVIGEIPFIANKENLLKIFNNKSRNPLFESIRIMVANLSFTNLENKSKGNLFLVTSSIKGEGKTIVSVNTAASLSKNNNNVLLLGADLRNPQIHKFVGLSKSKKGISDYIYNDNLNWESCIIKNEKFDILLSGTIPPNPTELLSSQKFNRFIDEIKKIYDYIIIDSAPCLLVSDTFEISKFVDSTIYVTRSNFSNLALCDFIKECHLNKKLKNINIVLNSVGNSQSYGYKYGYQYGYKYGYNYGYGYGYKEDS